MITQFNDSMLKLFFRKISDRLKRMHLSSNVVDFPPTLFYSQKNPNIKKLLVIFLPFY